MFHSYPIHLCVSKNSGTPKWMVIVENPIKMDDLGVPRFLETSISPACHPLESLVGFTSPGNASRRINSLGVKSLSSSASDGWRTGWETTRTNQRCLLFFGVGRLFGVYVYMIIYVSL